ncbi:MAG: glycine cleavage system protein R, partial [Actinomycetota bacterium]
CNLADCSMSRLREQFAMILLVEAPGELDAERLSGALAGPAKELGLGLTVNPVPQAGAAPPSRPFVVSLYGADQPGIVFRISKAMAERNVNIVDLTSHVLGGQIYAMVLDVDLPQGADPAELESDLRTVAGEIGVDLTFRSSEAAEL